MARQQEVAILFEDTSLLVVNKPSGLLSIPGREALQDSVLNRLRQRYSDLLAVHRLDRDTSGVLIFVKNADIHQELSLQFEERKVSKTYNALVVGKPAQQSFEINLKLSVDSRGKTIVTSNGKSSSIHFNVLESFRRYSFLEAIPLTGRQDQIRVHLAHVGHPLIVDPLYGSSLLFRIEDVKPGLSRHKVPEELPSSALLSRIPLHARSLSILHPAEGIPMIFEAPIPKDMLAALTQLRKWSR